MKYSVEQFKELALSEGFTNAGELNVQALNFMPEVREMCRADRCNAYGRNWRCPPALGSLEESAERVKHYSFGMLVQTVARLQDEFDYEAIEEAGKKHAADFVSLMNRLKGDYADILGMGAGTCRRCKECTYPHAPCRFPNDSYSSMEAYGLWVSKVCELSSLPYYYGKNTVTFTSCFLLP